MLFALFLIPLISALLVAEVHLRRVKLVAFILSLLPLLLFIYAGKSLIGADLSLEWFPLAAIKFHLKVDELSWVFLLLTVVIIPITFFAVKVREVSAPNLLFALILLLEGLLIAFFTSRDLFCFTFFYEAILFPVFFIITLFGGQERYTAALQFLIYMIAGSVLMVIAVLALYLTHGTFNMDQLTEYSGRYAPWLFAIFALAFAVKTPLFPFHAWLPDAYFEAPAYGTILLSALLSKAGIYGFLRIGLEIFPKLMQEWSPYLLTLAIIGVIYGALAAWKQTDFKRLLAYSSFSHVNFVLAGIFITNDVAHSGAVLQAFNHGVTIAALFLMAEWLRRRIGTTQIAGCSGAAAYFPLLAWLTLFFVLSSVALPGTNSFVGEIMILFGLMKQSPWATPFLTLAIILSAIYMLRFMQRVYFEEPRVANGNSDIGLKELIQAIPLVALVLWIGIYPAPLLKLFTKEVTHVDHR